MDLPAALEDDIIRTLDPPWNGAHSSRGSARAPIQSDEDSRPSAKPTSRATAEMPDSVPSEGANDPVFVITIGRTYFRQGFFNVPRAHEPGFAADGGLVEIRLPGRDTPLQAKVNRTANLNGTPRIMGGPRLRDWFQKTTRVGGLIRVRVQSKDCIEVVPV